MAQPQPLVTVHGIVAGTRTVPWESNDGLKSGTYCEVMVAVPESAIGGEVGEFPSYLTLRVETDDLDAFAKDSEVKVRCTAFSGIVGGRPGRFVNGVIFRPVKADIDALRTVRKAA